MPFFAPGNPNAFHPYPPPQAGGFPGGNLLLKLWGDAYKQAPWAVQPGVQPIPHQFPQIPGGGMLAPQPVADIYKFPPKMPGMLGATEGAGGRGLGSRGGGMLGSKWRDPGYIQQYEVQQGLKPGSIQQPSAPITTIAPQGPQRDFGKYNAKVTDPRMLTPEARYSLKQEGPMPKQPDLTRSLYDKVVEKYAPGGKWEYLDGRGVKMQGTLQEIIGKHDQGTDMTLAFRNSKGGLDLVSGGRLREARQLEPPGGPTPPAQMARPVQNDA